VPAWLSIRAQKEFLLLSIRAVDEIFSVGIRALNEFIRTADRYPDGG